MTTPPPAHSLTPETDLVATTTPTPETESGRAERWVEHDRKISAAIRASRAENTLRAYRTDWADFTTWCQTEDLTPLPATPATVAAYLAYLAEPPDDRPPLAIATIGRRKATISQAHTTAQQPNPCADELVRTVLRGLRRQHGIAPTARKNGVSTADITAMISGLDDTRSIDIRDKALLLTGFATALRRQSLVDLNVEDLEDHPEGIIVWVRRSKTDQEGAGRRIEVAYGQHPATCPVRAIRTWIDHAAITNGPIFRPVTRHGHTQDRRLTAQSVALVVKKHAARIGLDPKTVAGHSLRRGFATQTAANGAPDRTITRTTGHTNPAGLRPYIEDAQIFTDPPSKYLGL